MASFLLQPTEDELSVNHDEKVLLSLGYKQEFKREFSLWSAFSVSFAVLGLLPSFASTMYYGMGSAGTAGALTFFYTRRFVREYGVDIILCFRHDLGMDNCHDLHSMCRPKLGRTLLIDANKVRIVFAINLIA